MPSKELILVTGASGFLGAQVVDHLLQAEYAVRATCRSGKVDILRQKNIHPDFQVTAVNDLISDDFSAALEGVHGIVHCASPLAGTDDNIVEVAVEGTLNLLRQAHGANVHKFILVSSGVSQAANLEEFFDGSRVLTDKDWNPTTKEDALKPGFHPFTLYSASKALAERAAWDFADSHPKIDLTAILPPCIYGPISPRQIVMGRQSLSTNGWVYSLFASPTAAYPGPTPPQAADVRDISKAIVLSLKVKAAKPGERKRIPLYGGAFLWEEAVRHIAAVRPELKTRLVDGGVPAVKEETHVAVMDTSRAAELLGLTEFIGWKQSLEASVDSILEKEPSWAGKN